MRRVAACLFMATILGMPTMVRAADAAPPAPAPAAQATDCPAAICPAGEACLAGQTCPAGENCPANESCPDSEGCAVAEDCSVADDCSGDEDCLEEKLDHALAAMEHLEDAGMNDLARQVESHVAELRGELLKLKVVELASLQAEVAELRRATGQGQQVLVHVEILELSLTKLHNLGLDLPQLQPKEANSACEDCDRSSIALQVCKGNGIAGLFAALRQENVIKVLASPTLVTTDGRLASLAVGGEIPLPVKNADESIGVAFKKFGTQVDVVAKLTGDGKVRLEIRPRSSELDPTNSVTVQGVQVPGLRVREMNADFEMPLGQTAVLGGAVQERTHKVVGKTPDDFVATREEVQTIFLVTPELVTAAPPRQADAGSFRARRPRPR